MTDSPSPDAFLATYPPRVRRIANTLRALVRAAVPAAEERVRPGWKLVGYRTSADRGGRYFCSVAPLSDRALLGFEYGAWLSDPEGLLQGRGTQVRHVECRSLADARRARLRELVQNGAAIARLRATVPAASFAARMRARRRTAQPSASGSTRSAGRPARRRPDRRRRARP